MNGYKIVLLKAILCFIGCRKVNGYAPEYVGSETNGGVLCEKGILEHPHEGGLTLHKALFVAIK